MNPKFKSFIFDLDGTLINSLLDIADSVNMVLQRFDLPQHELDAYKYFVGNGIKVLAERSLPLEFDSSLFPSFLLQVETEYESRQTLRTKPYDGILETLRLLNTNKVPISVLSNKPHEFTKVVVNHFFPEIDFELILGAREHIARKPSPEAVYEIVQFIGLQLNEFAFVGDTATDIRTGKSAGIQTIGVSWGFRKVDELIDAGADIIIDSPNQLLKFC